MSYTEDLEAARRMDLNAVEKNMLRRIKDGLPFPETTDGNALRLLMIRLRHVESENDDLRDALEYEARVVEAHYEGYKTFPKSRRKYAREQVRRLRDLARGVWPSHYSDGGWRGMNNARSSRQAPAPEPSE